MPSYDLTEDNRGLSLDGRIINTELVGVRNALWARYLTAFNALSRDEAFMALELFNLCQSGLDLELYVPDIPE